MNKKKRIEKGFVVAVLIFLSMGCVNKGNRLGDKEKFLNEKNRPKGMVLIPAGKFLMGSTKQDGGIGIDIGVDELPQHTVDLPAFYMDQFEVTNSEYGMFREATGHPASALLTQEDFTSVYPKPEDNHPVLDVNWNDADAFCRWAGKRLPTEAEWEKAARGTDGNFWPWGNEADPGKTNTRESRHFWTHPVGGKKGDVSPYGVYDMAGNAMEWTSSWYDAYPGSPLKRKAFGKSFKVLRGASWGTEFFPFSRVTHRFSVLPGLAQPDFGIRCAKNVE